MNAVWWLFGTAIRLCAPALLGTLLAAALYEVWQLDTRWFVIVLAGAVGVAVSMCFARRFSDFLLVALFFCMPLMSFQKWFWPNRYSEEERGNLVYSGVFGLGLIDFLLVGLYLSWFYRVLVSREQEPPQFGWVDAAVFWFVVAHLLSSIGSSAPDLALGADEYLLKHVLMYLYVSRNLSARHLPWMLAAFGCTILLEASLSAVQVSTGKLIGIALDKGAGGAELSSQYTVPGLEGKIRATGTCYDSHSLGHFMGLLLPFPLVLCFTPKVRGALRLGFTLAAALAAATIVLSLSRSSWCAVAIALSIGTLLIVTVWRERQVIPALAAALVLTCAAAPLAGGYVYDRFAHAPSGLLTTRYDQYWVALSVIERYPLLGHGPGNWYESLQHYDYLWLEDVLPVHDVLLWLTADTGLIGVLGYLAIFVAAAARLIPVLRRRRDFAARLAMATLLSLVTTLLDGITDPTFREPNVFTTFWLLISLSVVVPGLAGEAGDPFLVPAGDGGESGGASGRRTRSIADGDEWGEGVAR